MSNPFWKYLARRPQHMKLSRSIPDICIERRHNRKLAVFHARRDLRDNYIAFTSVPVAIMSTVTATRGL